MCTIDSFIDRHASALQRDLGLRVDIGGEGDDRVVHFKLESLWCQVLTTAPIDPHVVIIQCVLPVPDLPDTALLRAAARVGRRVDLAKVLHDDQLATVYVCSVASPPGCLPTPENLRATLPALVTALASALITWQEECEFECLIQQEGAGGQAA